MKKIITLSEYDIQKIIAEKYQTDTSCVSLESEVYVTTERANFGQPYDSKVTAKIIQFE